MKKKIFNGLLVAAMLITSASAFVSCKDNVDDLETKHDKDIAELRGLIEGISVENGVDWATYNQLVTRVHDLEVAGAGLATKDDLAKLKQELLDELNTKLGAVTGINLSVASVWAPAYGELPTALVNANILAGFYGENADGEFQFPTLNVLHFADADQIDDVDLNLTEADIEGVETVTIPENIYGSVGTIYFTTGNTDVNLEGAALSLINSKGENAGFSLTPAAASDHVLDASYSWAKTRAAGAVLYETDAYISDDNIETLKEQGVNLKGIYTDVKDYATALKKISDSRTAGELDKVAKEYGPLAMAWFNKDSNANIGKKFQTLALSTGSSYSTFNTYAVGIAPLGYATLAVLKGNSDKRAQITNKVEEVLKSLKGVGLPTIVANNVENIAYLFAKYGYEALQPEMVIQTEDGEYGRAVTAYWGTSVKGSTITLYPTSRTFEYIAPAYKKFVRVTSDDGTVLDCKGLNEVLDGTTRSIEVSGLEAGHTYTIFYEAVDYAGKVVAHKSYLKVEE